MHSELLQAQPSSADDLSLNSARTWHIITCEYPPQSGGVSDYVHLLAAGLASVSQDDVHVWCPRAGEKAPHIANVTVHTSLGTFTPADLRAAGRELDQFPQPRRLFVQWVPHGYGFKSLNLPFCLWLWHRYAHRGDQIDLMVHEPFLPFQKGRWRQNAAATLHRLMMMVLLRTARRVWVSTPTWAEIIRPYAPARLQRFEWLPLPSTVPVASDLAPVDAIRRRYAPGGFLIGHFGTFGPSIASLLQSVLPPLLSRVNNGSAILIGPGSVAFRDRLIAKDRELAARVHAIGQIDAREPRLSHHLRACDLMIQPYPDGVTSRRTTAMAALAHSRATVTTTGALTEALWMQCGALETVEAGDTEAFVESAWRILMNPHKRAALEEAAGRFYLEHFAIERIVNTLRETTDGVAESRT